MAKIKYLDIEPDVNVYVVGDIHGSYTLLMQELHKIGFDFATDLLIGVGDLVDRGPENEKCVGLINADWFETVKGNHEDFCYKGSRDYHVEFYHKMENNGGAWFYQQPDGVKEVIARMMNDLPILMEVSYRGKKFGFVHADVPVEDWELLKEMVASNDRMDEGYGRPVEDYCMWNRGIVHQDTVEIAQIDNVFLGHTVLKDIKQVGNCTFLDTGAVFTGKMSIVNLKDYV